MTLPEATGAGTSPLTGTAGLFTGFPVFEWPTGALWRPQPEPIRSCQNAMMRLSSVGTIPISPCRKLATTMKTLFDTAAARSDRTWLALIVALGLLVRFAAIGLYPHTPESDELAYIAMAHHFVTGAGLVDSHGNLAMYNMGYPFFVLAPLFAVFGKNLLAVQIANALLGAVSVWLCHAVAKEAGAGRLGRLLAALMWAIYLPAGLYAVYVLKENLLIPLMLGIIWCALRFAGAAAASSVVRLAAGCGLLFGLVALTGNAALALAAPVALALLYCSGKGVRRLGAGVLIVAVAVLVSAPWMVRNARVLGAPVLNTNGGFNLYLGNNPLATGMFMSIADTPRGASWQALRTSGEVQASNTLKHEAVAWIAAHPREFVVLALNKLRFFWTPPLHAGQGPSSRTETLVRLAWAVQFLVLVGAALASVPAGRAQPGRIAVLWLCVAAYTGVHMIFYVIFRYREPIMPVVCVLAAVGIEHLLQKIRLKHPRALAS